MLKARHAAFVSLIMFRTRAPAPAVATAPTPAAGLPSVAAIVAETLLRAEVQLRLKQYLRRHCSVAADEL